MFYPQVTGLRPVLAAGRLRRHRRDQRPTCSPDVFSKYIAAAATSRRSKGRRPCIAFEIRRWAFTLADEPDAWAKGFDDSSWRAVTVPHDWSVEQEFSPRPHSSGTGYLPGGIGWYRAHVSLREVGEVARQARPAGVPAASTRTPRSG